MRTHLVVTLTGSDRIGLVDEITELLLQYQANVEASKMAHLGGEFAAILLLSLPQVKSSSLSQALNGLDKQGLSVVIKETTSGTRDSYAGWLPYQLKVYGADHEGIIHHITHYLAQQGINIESMDTFMAPAPMSGTPLFTMSAIVIIPPRLDRKGWKQALQQTGDDVNVSCEIHPYTG